MFIRPMFGESGPAYDPAMMNYDGSTGYYWKDTTGAGGADVTLVIRFNEAAFTGGGTKVLLRQNTTTINNNQRVQLYFRSSDYATTEEQSKLLIHMKTAAASTIVNVQSNIELADGNDHVLFMSRKGSDGSFNFVVDGTDVEDSGYSARVLASGTPTDGGAFMIGSSLYASWSGGTGGEAGYFGYKDTYLTNSSDFMSGSNPKELDETTWTEWGAQPLFWNRFGEMTDNKGSGGNMTKTGTITGPA